MLKKKVKKMLKSVKKRSEFKNVMDGQTEGPTDRARCRVACTRLKKCFNVHACTQISPLKKSFLLHLLVPWSTNAF